jgi:hypothetical protein
MLLTDVWSLLEHLAISPPAHVLLQYIAPTFGYKAKSLPQSSSAGPKNPVSAGEAAKINRGQFDFGNPMVMKSGFRLLKKTQVPSFVQTSADDIVQRMKAG